METIRRKLSTITIELVDYYHKLERAYTVDEPQSYEWLIKNVKPDWVCLDIGAHVGTYTILLSNLCSQVYAFEANMDTFYKLEHNLQHNGLNPATFCIAVGEKTVNQREEQLWYAGKVSGPTKGVFDFIAIDDFVSKTNLSNVNFIKIDVDGWDYEVLQGARNTIEKFKPAMIVEVNRGVKCRGHTTKQFIQYFYDLGYWIKGIGYPYPGNWLCLPETKVKSFL